MPTNGTDNAMRTIWGRFWFSPTDPSTLGFIRIVIGLIVFYLHFAYVVDYREFFGPDGWWSQRAAEKQRREMPRGLANLNWEDPVQSLHMPETAHRRAAVMDFMRSLPENGGDRKYALRFIAPLIENCRDEDLSRAPNIAVVEALRMAGAMPRLFKDDETKVWTGMVKETLAPKDIPVQIPLYLLEADLPTRVRTMAEMRDFLAMVVRRITDPDRVEYVLSWLRELMPSERQRALEFMVKLPADPAERDAILDQMYTWGSDPRQSHALGRFAFSFWLHVSDPAAMWTVYFLHLGAIAMFALGWYTRITSVLTWLGMVNLAHRNPFCIYGMDAMMSLMLFYMAVGPSAAAFSIDRLRARYRAARALQNAGGKPVPWASATLAGPQPSAYANCIVRMMQVHYSFMYLSAGFSKLKGHSWWDMTAPWMVMANPEFCPTHFSLYESALHAAAQNRVLISAFCMAGVFMTLATEIGLPFLVWTRFRPYAVMMSVLMHLGIDFYMGLSVFSLIMHAWILCYFPARLIRERVAPAPGGSPIKLRYDPDDAGQARGAAIIRALDVTGRVREEMPAKKGPDEDAALRLTVDGRTATGGEIAALLWAELPLLQMGNFLTWIPGFAFGFRKVLGV